MSRKTGSGLHHGTSTTIERLIAETFVATGRMESIRQALAKEVARGRCGVSVDAIDSWIKQIVDHLGLPVRKSETPSPDHLGDVRLTLSDESLVWIEVKAQTTKQFSDLVQADWVRDETDTLRWLVKYDEQFHELTSDAVIEQLGILQPAAEYFGSWGFADLWLADLGLLHSRSRRITAEVHEPHDLPNFLARKFLLHVSNEGARLVRLDQLHCVQDVIAGAEPFRVLAPGSSSDTKLWLSTEGPPQRGSIDFIYYTGYRSGVLGRHKLHHHAVDRSSAVHEVREQ